MYNSGMNITTHNLDLRYRILNDDCAELLRKIGNLTEDYRQNIRDGLLPGSTGLSELVADYLGKRGALVEILKHLPGIEDAI